MRKKNISLQLYCSDRKKDRQKNHSLNLQPTLAESVGSSALQPTEVLQASVKAALAKLKLDPSPSEAGSLPNLFHG